MPPTFSYLPATAGNPGGSARAFGNASGLFTLAQHAGALNSGPTPQASGGFNPQQLQHAYGFDQITFQNGNNTIQGDGSGQTIAIVDAYNQPNIVSDLAAFDTAFNLPAPPTFQVVNQTGGSTLPTSDPDWGLEISLDVEWAHAMAPGANILLVEATAPRTLTS